MKRKITAAHISYWFDCIMSKGPIALSVLLFAVTMAVVGIIGLIAFFVSDDGSLVYQVWNSLMHTLDAGTLAGNSTDNIPYLLLMTAATLCGLFITSTLIGVIATGVEGKLSDLRKGTSVVQEEDHTVIIGFDGSIYSLLKELIEANSNKKSACIVVLGKQPKDEIEDAISSHIPDTRTTRIICRSGNLHEGYALERCRVEASRSVIINIDDDAEIIKVILALSAYLKSRTLTHPDLRIIASMQDSQYIETAVLAGEGRAEIIYTKDAIARIISNTCRQHGLSQVLTELFNFSGNEFYFENIPSMAGKTFKEAMLCFSNAIPSGLCSNGKVMLNPPMDTVIKKDDQLIVLEMDDGDFRIHDPKKTDASKIISGKSISAKASDRLIILGSNNKLPIILTEFEKYTESGSKVIVVDDDLDAESLGSYEKLDISVCTAPVTRDLLSRFLSDNTGNILLLNDDSSDPETSDSQTLLRLIMLRDIADKTGRHLSITTEMRNVDNQRLASQARVDDFVIGSNFASLLMAQVSENPNMMPLIIDLLDESGSELYMKPAFHYVPVGVPVDSYILTESAAQKGEIYLGYRHSGNTDSNVVINPAKADTIIFGEHDQIVTIAED